MSLSGLAFYTIFRYSIVSAPVLIIPQGGWLLSKHSTMFQVFFDPRIEISMPNKPP
jgi:hypothetical protein